MKKYLPAILIFMMFAAPAANNVIAQTSTPRGEILVSGDNHRFTSGIDSWRGVTIATLLHGWKGGYWNGEINMMNRFNEASFAYGVGYTQPVNRWIFSTNVRTSTAGFYNPKFRLDVQVGRKLREDQRLVVLVSGFRRIGRDGHDDIGFGTEFQYYASRRWIVQSGGRLQLSNPGQSWGYDFYAAATFGTPGKRQISARIAYALEAYSVLYPLVIFTDFESQSASLFWKEWISPEAGAIVSLDYYGNPYYNRKGFKIGFFFAI